MVADIDKAKLEPRHFEARRFLRILLLFFFCQHDFMSEFYLSSIHYWRWTFSKGLYKFSLGKQEKHVLFLLVTSKNNFHLSLSRNYPETFPPKLEPDSTERKIKPTCMQKAYARCFVIWHRVRSLFVIIGFFVLSNINYILCKLKFCVIKCVYWVYRWSMPKYWHQTSHYLSYSFK